MLNVDPVHRLIELLHSLPIALHTQPAPGLLDRATMNTINRDARRWCHQHAPATLPVIRKAGAVVEELFQLLDVWVFALANGERLPAGWLQVRGDAVRSAEAAVAELQMLAEAIEDTAVVTVEQVEEPAPPEKKKPGPRSKYQESVAYAVAARQQPNAPSLLDLYQDARKKFSHELKAKGERQQVAECAVWGRAIRRAEEKDAEKS